MKKFINFFFISFLFAILSCKQSAERSSSESNISDLNQNVDQAADSTDPFKLNIVQAVIDSKDHQIFVSTLKAAQLIDALSNAGPYTVFAPNNSAFEKLPATKLQSLLTADKKDDLDFLLGYHTYVGILKTDQMQSGDEFEMVYGGRIKVKKVGNQVFVNGTPILGSIETANGIVHVIGDVLLPS